MTHIQSQIQRVVFIFSSGVAPRRLTVMIRKLSTFIDALTQIHKFSNFQFGMWRSQTVETWKSNYGAWVIHRAPDHCHRTIPLGGKAT